MKRGGPVLFAASLMFTSSHLVSGAASAQSLTILDSIEILTPGLTVSIVQQLTLDGSDPTFCAHVPPYVECSSPPAAAAALGVDASGAVYNWSGLDSGPSGLDLGGGKAGYVLQRTRSSGPVENVLYFFRRICDSGSLATCTTHYRSSELRQPALDITNGRILLPMTAQLCFESDCPPAAAGMLEVAGLPQLFDTLMSFIPGQHTLNIVTPAHPDGFRSADSLQAWTGNLRSMPDWSQAAPLTCEAAANPTPGQIVSVADTLPAPAVGEGHYYLVASQSGGDRRLGREYVNGAFAARQPAGLPVCQ